MPSTSKRQHNFMEMIAHDPAAAKRVGVKQSVGKDYVAADKGSDLSKLPDRVQHKAKGGAVQRGAFKW